MEAQAATEAVAVVQDARQQPTPAPVVDTAAELVTARAALLKELQADGLEVLPVADDRLFVGKIRKIADPHFVVQGVGRRSVVIHELGQLDGEYAAGQLAEIKYQAGRGRDQLQGLQGLQGRQQERPGR